MPVPECHLVSELGMFRVLQSVGKSFSSGGYGVSLPVGVASQNEHGEGATALPTCLIQAGGSKKELSADSDVQQHNDDEVPRLPAGEREISTRKTSLDHLFVEEALFLQQQGLLRVLSSDRKYELSTQDLFQVLSELQISLPVYLSYAHLRSQDYRVLRHVPARMRSDHIGKLALREQTRRSKAPQVVCSASGSATTPAWDVYLPNTNFRKTSPGVPDTCVIVTNYNGGESALTFDSMCDLLKYCRGEDETMKVNVQIAAVADSGTVVMFGLTDIGVEDISGGDGSAHGSVDVQT